MLSPGVARSGRECDHCCEEASSGGEESASALHFLLVMMNCNAFFPSSLNSPQHPFSLGHLHLPHHHATSPTNIPPPCLSTLACEWSSSSSSHSQPLSPTPLSSPLTLCFPYCLSAYPKAWHHPPCTQHPALQALSFPTSKPPPLPPEVHSHPSPAPWMPQRRQKKLLMLERKDVHHLPFPLLLHSPHLPPHQPHFHLQPTRFILV